MREAVTRRLTEAGWEFLESREGGELWTHPNRRPQRCVWVSDPISSPREANSILSEVGLPPLPRSGDAGRR